MPYVVFFLFFYPKSLHLKKKFTARFPSFPHKSSPLLFPSWLQSARPISVWEPLVAAHGLCVLCLRTRIPCPRYLMSISRFLVFFNHNMQTGAQ